jgi:hypothetical protein
VTTHLVSLTTLSGRSMPVRFAALALAVVFTTSQIQAQGPMPRGTDEAQPTTTSQSQQQAATSAPSPATGLPAPASNSPAAAAETANLDATVLPEAPNAPQEQASINKPIDFKAMLDDAGQNTQNLQSTPVQQKRQIHPGWLALSAIGALGAVIGADGLASKGTRGRPIAGAFLGVGAGLAGLGIYLTFK